MGSGRHERRFSVMKIDLQIGGYRIRLHEREDYGCFFWPIRPFVPFLVRSNEPPDLGFTVTVTNHLPDLPRGRLIFNASHGLWKLYEAEFGCLLESPDTHTLEPLIRALISRDFSRIEVWVRPHHARRRRKHRVGWEPTSIINPLVEVCLATKLAREGGLLLHAAGVLTEREGGVFTGASRAGKSNFVHRFAARGAGGLSGGRLILRKGGGGILVLGP